MPDLVEVDLAGVCPESAYLLPVRSTRDPGRSVTTASGRCLSARVSGSPMGRCHDVDHNFDGRPDMIRVAPPHELVQQDSHIVMGEGVQDPKKAPTRNTCPAAGGISGADRIGDVGELAAFPSRVMCVLPGPWSFLPLTWNGRLEPKR